MLPIDARTGRNILNKYLYDIWNANNASSFNDHFKYQIICEILIYAE